MGSHESRSWFYGSTLWAIILCAGFTLFLFHPATAGFVPRKIFLVGVIVGTLYFPILLLKIFADTGEWIFQDGIISYRSLWRALLSRPPMEVCEVRNIRSVDLRPVTRVRIAFFSHGLKAETKCGASSASFCEFFCENLTRMGVRHRVRKVGSWVSIYLKGGDPDDDDQDIDPI